MYDTTIHAPEIEFDEVTDTVIWIGEDMAVECSPDIAERMSIIADMATQYGRDGITPESLGIKVTTFGDTYVDVIHSQSANPERWALDSLWRGLRRTVGHEFVQIAALLDESALAK